LMAGDASETEREAVSLEVTLVERPYFNELVIRNVTAEWVPA